jgi:hypothetical protein
LAVALLLNVADLTTLQASLNTVVAEVGGADRTAANRILTAIGIPNQQPVAPVERQQGDPDTRVIVLNYSGATRQQFLDLIIKFFNQNPTGREWLRAIWKDARTSAVEPWP